MSYPQGSRLQGRKKKQWRDQIKQDMNKMNAMKDYTEDGTKQMRIVKEAKYYLGYAQPQQ